MQFELSPSTWNGRPTLAVEVTNDGERAEPDVSVHWMVDFDSPVRVEADWVFPAGVQTGEGVSFVTEDGTDHADIPPGGREKFFVHPVFLDKLVLSWIASLAPDRRTIEVRSGSNEVIERYPGSEFAHLLPALAGG